MTNREDRLAQILRRGEEMKRRHKKRQMGILLTCVPLILCMILYGGRSLSARMPAGAAPENAGEAPGQVLDGSVFLQTVSIQVQTLERAWTVEDPERVMQVLQCLEENALTYEFTSAQSAAGSALPTEETAEESTQEQVTFSLVLRDGTQRRYLLSETVLTEEHTGKQHAITKAQYESLRRLLEQEEKDVAE